MRKALLCLAAIGALLAPARAGADGFGILGAAPGVDAPPYRYVALSPRTRPRLTVVERLDTRDASIDRWWTLRGSYFVPAVAYDGSGGGLAGDGGTLVLATLPGGYPPRRTEFAILDTRLFLRHPRPPGSPRHAVKNLSLSGGFSFDAISPDGKTIYLIQNLFSGHRLTGYSVRAVETATGRLLPRPVVDPSEPDEKMQGSPITRLTSAGGRWAYTLYDAYGKTPFLHALDTVRRRAVCVDLPQFEGENPRDLFLLRMRFGDGGRRILVYRHSRRQGGRPSSPLLQVDTTTFDVSRPRPQAAVAAGAAGMPWLPLGVAVAALVAGLGWKRRRSS